MIRVRGLDHISFQVADVDATADFYVERWGLQPFAQGERGARYLRAVESGHHVLELRPGSSTQLDHLAFEVADQDDLQRAADDARIAGLGVEREPGAASEPGHRGSVRPTDPDGNAVELLWQPQRVHDSNAGPPVKPKKLGHVVLNTPRSAEMEAFYRRLGFRVSDRTARGMTFMRCNSDHHTLALMQSKQAKLQHCAYDALTLDNVMQAMGTFKKHGLPCIWGPGRHGPGDNIFSYYADPAGNVVEYYAELEQVDPDEEPAERFWGPEWGGDLWNVAGPPPEAFLG